MGNAKLDWRRWIDEGLVDTILACPSSSRQRWTPTRPKRDISLTCETATGTVTVEQLKAYIEKSAHPEIKVIQTGASSYFYEAPPKGADGWQCDAWYDSYHVAFYRNAGKQWMKDLADFGSIKFF